MIRIRLLLIFFISLICLGVKAQATSLVIDNQSPGWLSSKIGYADQQTVKNLKVTGYLNTDDLKFIADLMKNHSLKGRLDLENANIVGSKPSEDNIMQNGIWGTKSSSSTKIYFLEYFSYPKTLTGGVNYAFGQMSVDTLFINSVTMFTGALGMDFQHIIIGENVEVLYGRSFTTSLAPATTVKTLTLPQSLREIREHRNSEESWVGIECSITEYANFVEIFPNLERLCLDYINYENMPDSVYFPKIRFLALNQYQNYDSKRLFKKDMHIFIGEEIDTLTQMSYAFNINLHFSSPKPPVIESSFVNHRVPGNDSRFVLYVPKGSADAYRACFKDNGTKVTIIEEVTAVTEVNASKHVLNMNVGDTERVFVTVLPQKATDKSVKWTSSDENVAWVSTSGVVTASNAGEAEIVVSSISNPNVADTIKVNVVQPVYSINVFDRQREVYINGDPIKLFASVSPYNATDKSVLWTSRDTAIAVVDSSGVVTGKKAGKVYIVATAASNPEAKDSCEVTVLQPVTGITMSQEELTFTEIGQTKQLKATVSPDDASNKAVRWRSFNENVCSVSESGYVVAVGYGSAVITATSVDGGFVGTCICKVIEKAPDPIMGDVDNNREVNLLDIVKTVDYIMKRPIDNFYVSLADFDGDEKITVADLVEIVSIVSSQSQINGMVAASNIGSGKVCMTTNDDGTLSLGVKDSRMYIATQMVVELSDNQRLVDVSSIDGHNVVFRNIGGNRYSVISYSNQNNVYESSDRMINLAITGDGFVNVESVLAVDVDRRSVVFENNDVEYVTGIAEITVDFNQPTDIYTVGGVLIKRNATSTEGLPKGMYIINNKKYYKK